MNAAPTSGLFIDLDGTLADSLGVMRAVYGRFLANHGRPASDAEFDSLNGPPLARVVERLTAAHGLDGDPEDLLAEYGRLIDQSYGAVPPTPGVRALLEAARGPSWIVGVVTSNDQARTRGWLDSTGLSDLVDVLVTGGEAANGKPDPDPYLLALERGRCEPSRSVAVEDSPDGARAALAAGLTTFAYDTDPQGAPAWPQGVHPVTDLAQVTSWIADRQPEGSS